MPEDWLDEGGEADAREREAAAERERRRQEREARRGGHSRRVREARKRRKRMESGRGRGGAGGSGARGRAGGGSPLTARRLVGLGVVAIGLAFVWVGWTVFQPFHGDGGERINVEVPEGAGADLAEQGVVANSSVFELRATLAGKRSEIYPGTYTLAEDMSYSEAIEALSTIPVERTVTITIPEGYSRPQAAEIAAGAGLSGDYMRASVESELLDPARYGGRNAQSLEGFLFPATYELPAEAGAAALVNSQLRAFEDRLAGIDLRYARSKNLTVYDVLTIASMIDREVSIPRERRLAAAVIYNRLSDGIPLGIDATTRFAVDNYTDPLTQSELDSDSLYNTRNRAGLPPGPIGNPGEEAIRAAARPADSNVLYYVVEPGTCGEHSFSATYEEFEADVAAYNQAREEAGGQSPTDCP